ncbi:ankyrin repeat protein [Fowlpox virus]|uniref:Putative ankyrin repeat protein FPV240 n=2 Tax=Fowlpox virus TaxID=10261 RepID=V240_FOWPN|nr:ankyrin repeat protein [Fowlpox virus]P14360.1 RecName: Full=Putative ankyrin repeat protein FPV240; AltName: Full=BamHI-ORF7 [Fowlpox virus strain NVSL]UNS14485.1 ALPV-321 [Albatrosspox virus]WPD90985.1 ankyrin repeat family protein [Avipoxvirus sp.]CAE52775.1 putative ankyrin-repeat protein [Fowlpox virus isolate HP-438/Munich]AAF44584.1 ORF FPV240 Ankyrin repeat gene family protein [Fowlpox virus]ART91673.1 ankyrin repeat family protein [Fowlpox virus]
MDRVELCNAILFGELDVARRLLDSYINPNFTINGYSPIKMAVRLRDVEMIKLLMSYNTYPDYNYPDIESELHEAVEEGDVVKVEELLDSGKFINDVIYKKGNTPLHLATISKNLDMMRLLIARGADTDVPNTDRFTPLHLAVMSKDIKGIELLLDHRACTNIEDCYGCTPLIIAMSKGDTEVCRMLLDSGANIDYFSKRPCVTAMCYAIQNNKIDMVSMFLKRGADSNIVFTVMNEEHTTLEMICNMDTNPESESVDMLIADIALRQYTNTISSDKGFSRNMTVINSKSRLKDVFEKCKIELRRINSESIRTYNILDLCLKPSKNLDENILARHSRKILGLYDNAIFYKYLLKELADTASQRAEAIESAMRVIDEKITGDETKWNWLPHEIKYNILEYIGNKELDIASMK